MKSAMKALESLLERRGAGWVLLALVAVAYLAAYRLHDLYPGTGDGANRGGWWTWADQSKYLQQAEAIAAGAVSAETYFYPLGYSVLAAPFVTWMPAHAFLVPNLALVLGAAAVWWRIGRRWLSAAEVVGVGVIFVGTHGWLLADSVVVPWNTLATQLTMLAGVWVVARGEENAGAERPLAHARSHGSRRVWILAALAAATYLVRPVDVVAFGPLLAWAVWRVPGWGARVRCGGIAGLVVMAAWAAVGWLNLKVFGSWRTPYEAASMETVGFFGYPVSFKAFGLLLDGMPLFGEVEPGMLWRYPWLWFAAPAAVWWVWKDGGAGAAAAGAVGANAFVYLNYNDLTPAGIYRFTLIHYFGWWFPLMFLVVVAAAKAVWVKSGAGSLAKWAVAGVAVALMGAGVRLEPRVEMVREEAGGGWRLPEARPVLVWAREEPVERVKELRLDGRELVEPSQYLVPYVPSDLKVLVGRKARGEVLTVAGDAGLRGTVEVGRLGWTWRMSGDRVRKVGRWVMWHAGW
jgi:hypothetical protein